MRRALLVFLVLYLLAVSCGTVSDPPLYTEEAVLKVWDFLDEHYGRETFFECDIHTVHKGQIRVVRPYDISRITVVGYSSLDDGPVLFRLVLTDPDVAEFVVKEKTLSFYESYEGQRLLVAWVPQPSPTSFPQPPGGIRER